MKTLDREAVVRALTASWQLFRAFVRSSWDYSPPKPIALDRGASYSWCRAVVKKFILSEGVVISVPMPKDVDPGSIELVSSPKSIGLRFSRIGCDNPLCRSFGALGDRRGPALWQLTGGDLLIRMRVFPNKGDTQPGLLPFIGNSEEVVEGVVKPRERNHRGPSTLSFS